MAACGLDFGTSNTTLGAIGPDGPALMALGGAVSLADRRLRIGVAGRRKA